MTVASVAKASNKPKGKPLRSLWANAHGSFTTKGSGGAAAVLGTKWLTEDTCAGTCFRVVRDKVEVTVYYPHPHKVVVTRVFVVRAQQGDVPIIKVSPVTATSGHYNVHITGTYSLDGGQRRAARRTSMPLLHRKLPGSGTTALVPDGSVNGIRAGTSCSTYTQLSRFQDWNVGVQIGDARCTWSGCGCRLTAVRGQRVTARRHRSALTSSAAPSNATMCNAWSTMLRSCGWRQGRAP